MLAGEFTLRSADREALRAVRRPAPEPAAESLEDIEGLGPRTSRSSRSSRTKSVKASAQIDDAPVVKLINAILTDAVKRGASDIHFECFEHELRVRYRIDGALQEVMKPPIKMRAALISRFKIMAQLNIAERRVPQDGRIKLKMGNKVIDFRVVDAADAVRREDRAPNPRQGQPDARPREVRLRAAAEKELMEAISNPYGMVLVTGPTGSGKTTTLYSALSKINTIDVNIMTAEDPVEYNLFGINQVLVRNEIGMTFAAALKAFLRQDPNIIMVGEIRDLETGGIAIKAALTGHLVLSHAAHQRRARDDHASDRHGARAVQRGERRQPDPGAAAGAPHLRRLQGGEYELRANSEEMQRHRSIDREAALPVLARARAAIPAAAPGYKGRQGLYEVMALTPSLAAR